MKNTLLIVSLICALLFSASISNAQKISVDGTVSVQDLILDNFADGCVEISNIRSTVNGDATGFRSYAEFDRAGTNFPFQNGIMLTTGNAESGGNTNTTTTLSEGSDTWETDIDLENALGISNTINATSIEFDFISISSQFQFNYLFASEEYEGANKCNASDGFAFLIKETGSTAPFENIALIPGTTTPLNTFNVRNAFLGLCDAQNEQYYAGSNLGDTNYNGRTTVLTASTTITPYVQYHVKLVIADQTDRTFDSAVFIEGNSFEILDLGEDIDTCAQSVTLNADIQNPNSTYEWFLNNSTTPIPNETNPTISVTQSGSYRVEISTPLGASNCIEEDVINVTISNEITLDPLTDYEQCDDSSGDEVEIFDLSTKDAEVQGIITFPNFSFSYHLSDSDARNDSNPITTPIQNTSLIQPIFIRINDLNSGCVAISSFNLVLNTIPNTTAPSNIEICDVDNDPSDSITVIDLSEKDDEITNSNPELLVSYHYNPNDAENGDNPIPRPFTGDANTTPFINSSNPQTVYVRVINENSGCYTTTDLTIDITNGPDVDQSPFPLDGCDTDLDGTDNFDLTSAINDILEGLTNVTVSFHENRTDAETDTNPIANETNYENVVSEVQTVFVRVEDNTTMCATIVPLEIHTNLLLTGTDTGDFALCDDPSNDGTVDFSLNTIERYIFEAFADENGDIPPEYRATFYLTENERDNRINPINTNNPFPASNPTTLFLVLESNSCSEVDQINLRVDPVLNFSTIAPVPYCDDDDDGITTIDLSFFDDIVTDGNTNFTPSYFATLADAESNFNPLPPFYSNSQPQETIYVRLENIGTGCFTTNEFEIGVVAAPTITQPAPWIICDNDGVEGELLDLESRIPLIVTSTSGLNFSYFPTLDDANNEENPLDSQSNFDPGVYTVYVRVQSTNSECFAIAEQEIILNTLPEIDNIPPFLLCEDDNDQRTEFVFSNWDAQVLNGQTGKEVFYFEDAGLNIPIDKNSDYINISSPQTIYVWVQNITDVNCNATSFFSIEVGANPIYTVPTPVPLCDVGLDGTEIFDLNDKIVEITSTSPDPSIIDVTFYTSQTDAESNTSPITNLMYTNTSILETLFVRIENSVSSCYFIENFAVEVINPPDLSEAEDIILCDDDYDGMAIFNLENAVYENFDRFSNDVTVNYFENSDDVDDNSLAINNPTQYSSTSKTVYIKVTNNQTTCYTAIPLQLTVLPLPVINFNGTYDICDNESNTFDLNVMNSILVNDINAVSISYFNTLTNAQNNTGALNNIFNYTLSNHIIYTRIESLTNGCVTYSNFTLQINENPTANTPQDLIKCDDDDDGLLFFDLTEANQDILGTQPENDYVINFYGQLIDAENDENRLNNLYESTNDEVIYVRIQNVNTGCYSTTEFRTFINPLPVIPLNDIETLCLDNLPLILDASTGNPNDTYSWSTAVNPSVNGSTSPTITINNPLELGEYEITITTVHSNAEDCSSSKAINVIQSEQANNVISTKTDFTDPNTITIDVSGIGNYIFSLDDGEPQTSNIFENVTIGPHTVTIEDLNGCSPVTTEVFVIDIPKFVTPNGDGSFDTWHIVGANMLPGSQVFIYNRHGKLLKMLPHTSPGWDGTFNGQHMPADDYWFTADIVQNGDSFTLKGHFTLKR
ncbi:MAG: choice-of-anchor L domain-containing protein [Jejuia sp.]